MYENSCSTFSEGTAPTLGKDLRSGIGEITYKNRSFIPIKDRFLPLTIEALCDRISIDRIILKRKRKWSFFLRSIIKNSNVSRISAGIPAALIGR